MFKNHTLALPQYAVIRATGGDAAAFLHGQLSHDFLLMKPHEARLAAYCTAKGRMLASFIAQRSPESSGVEGFDLIVAADLLESTLKRLRMFVMRSKVTLQDMRGTLGVQGHITPLNDTAPASWTIENGCIQLPPALGMQRQMQVCDAQAITLEVAETLETPETAGALQTWNWLEVHSGVVMVQAATSELFVPQMLNYESVGGVNFKKGCYPGQEIVARSQFRGQIKRRAYLLEAQFESNTPLPAGTEVFTAEDSEQPCGVIAQSAAYKGHIAVLASLQTQAASAQAALLCNGIDFKLAALPYALLEDI